ncbi:MAG: hydantoinase/oxoprolinase family protein [Pseudomonadota bacterium]
MEIIGIDTGGTFTDFIYKHDGKWGVFKQLSTPSNPAESVLSGIRRITSSDVFQVVHGSTVATNAILERKGAVTALITNQGFEDVFAIGRQNRTELYNTGYRKAPLIVPSSLRFGVNCRVTCDGQAHIPFDENSASEVVRKIAQSQAESIAVCFLFSYLNHGDELRMEKLLEPLNIPVSLSHRILSEFREYERTSTTVVNAYVSPIMKRYINHITENLGGKELRIMQSNGGSISAATAMDESVRTILSGPAGGAVGAFEIGKMAGMDKLITFDMGGTSTDVALIDGGLPLTFESTISDFPVKVPMIDIHTVGAGGGSISRMDAGGSLKVGPESAGADPGPICYGKGQRITVTDANLYLGRLVPEQFLGGNMTLDVSRLESHFQAMAKEAGLTTIALAEGILAVANTAMEKAIRVISVERGFDPAEFALFSFGGAGGLHAVFLARLLNIPIVFVPRNPGILSAVGMLMADVIKDYSLTVMLKHGCIDHNGLSRLFEPLETRGIDDLKAEGISRGNITVERFLDMRYKGQSYEIMVPFDSEYEQRFHSLHEKSYGYASPEKAMEIVNIRLRSRGTPEKPEFEIQAFAGPVPDTEAFAGKRSVVFSKITHETDLVLRNRLKHGNIIQGPAIVLEYTSTLVMPPDTWARVDAFGNLIITTRSEGGR